MKEVIYQNPPSNCDICKKRIGSVFYDCSVTIGIRTTWANVCPQCFELYGRGLGTGLGQKFQYKDGEYRKVAG